MSEPTVEGVKISQLPPTSTVLSTGAVAVAQSGATFQALPPAFPFNRVFVQNTAPTAQRTNDLWIDTSGTQPNPKYWNGTSWISWQNTDSGAGLALATLKNRVFVEGYPTNYYPLGPTNPVGGYTLRVGDLWLKADLGTTINPNVWTGTAWVPVEIKINPQGGVLPFGNTASYVIGNVTTGTPAGLGAFPGVSPFAAVLYPTDGKLYRWDQTITAYTARVDGADVYGVVGGATYP
jgi:hypothetical protein